MGDFYEMFGEDAVTGAAALGITLTSREFARGDRVPMAGIPHHALQSYLKRFVQHGLKVAKYRDRAVGSHEDTDDAGFEIFQGTQPLILGPIGMDRPCLDAAAFEPARKPVGPVFGSGKYEDGIELRIAQKMEQERGF